MCLEHIDIVFYACLHHDSELGILRDDNWLQSIEVNPFSAGNEPDFFFLCVLSEYQVDLDVWTEHYALQIVRCLHPLIIRMLCKNRGDQRATIS